MSPGAQSPFSLHPEGPLPANLRGRFAHDYRYYSALYGYDAAGRTIKRFVALGKAQQPHDLPPLDTPADMPAWYRRLHGGRVPPEGILRAARAVPVPSPVPVPIPPSEEKPSATPAPPVPIVPDAPTPVPLAARDFPAQVECHRLATDEARAAVTAATRATVPPELTDPADIAAWHKTHALRIESAKRALRDDLELLRKLEDDLLDWQKKHEQVWPRAEVASENARIANAIHTAVERLALITHPRIAHLTAEQADKIWREAVRGCFRVLKDNKYVQPFTLDDLEEKAA